mgnify:FL=1
MSGRVYGKVPDLTASELFKADVVLWMMIDQERKRGAKELERETKLVLWERMGEAARRSAGREGREKLVKTWEKFDEYYRSPDARWE